MGFGRRFTIVLLLLTIAGGAAEAAARRARRPRVRSRTPALPGLILPSAASQWDLAVGEASRRAVAGTAGAVVALDPRTGRTLAIVNPARALARAYQPCSVFKIVVAIAGLSEGVITPDTSYACRKGCWMWPGHGAINLRRALAVSCNPYFEWIGERLGYEKVQHYAQLLGLGEPTGINVTGEAAGRIPAFVAPSAVGHLSSHAAGIQTSALQLAVLLSATINGGIVFQPQLGPLEGFAARERWRLPEKTRLDGLRDGFLGAVNEGSATSAFDPDLLVAGKTGSCSRVGWFASYAPADRPELVVVVFLPGGNGHAASQVAGRIYQDVFRRPPAGAAPPTVVGGGS
jgi:penicillin-binding protein 2